MNNETKVNLIANRLTGDVDPLVSEMLLLADRLGVIRAEVPFHGEGDSGNVENPDLYLPTGLLVKSSWSSEQQQYVDNGVWSDDHDHLMSLVAEYAGRKVDAVGVDWYNDEGGGGSVNFDFTKGKVEVEAYEWERRRVNEQSDEFDMISGKEAE